VFRLKSYKERDNWLQLIRDLQAYSELRTSTLETICNQRSDEVEEIAKKYKLISYKLDEKEICETIQVNSVDRDILKKLMDQILKS